jgi:hypothetical protein
VCDGDTESPACVCAPGYEGDSCTWIGVLKDPGFEDGQAWMLRSAAINTFEEGPTGDGIATLTPRSACFAGRVSQTVEMPSYEVGEPLVAEVTYQAEGSFGLSLGFGRAWTQLPPSSADVWATERVCLGDAAYGGEVLVQIAGAEQHPTCFDTPLFDVRVDHLDIIPAGQGECPAPGEVLNGSGDAAKDGWQYSAEDGASFEFAPGAGREGTSGVRLVRDGESRLKAWTKLSIPSAESVPSPALRFWWAGDNETQYRFKIGRATADRFNDAGELPLDEPRGNGSELNYVYCLPPWTHGNVVDLIFEVPVPESREPAALVVDDIEIVSDEGCGSSPDVLDPGFEAGPARIMGVTNFTPDVATVRLRTDPLLAHSGDGALELTYSNEGARVTWETWVLLPESNGVEGPTVFYWANVPSTVETPLFTRLGRAAVKPAPLIVGGGWQRSDPICPTPEWAGRWFRVKFELGERPPMGNLQLAPTSVYIDDLEVTTTPNCPAE